ncbi:MULTISPECIES: long-chain-fatty-acid--CoA ligase [Bradyrhizobium]|uniref:Long-chain-fatty-acid--CoA ligase n=1 Tax=Bradyrhizobium brasilense TaxID=1419277 RepID=A0ABY8JD19_9BRAD|nr:MULTISPECIES: long-chain fatty acid--CoA ligase [Bradyrhizobium]MCP1846461.1 long-chain acyl-CoA synthetase [Bradyrhizobium sp. USDA 4541]MCP1910449.1 long-chain acyl-CoA synthetase [Bradyrhizobium elkanii]OMI14351.1 dicarboxylate--CoA ligase PimA [Bradyrhizobium brasilense]WFU63302.1 long-chain fatty acid--CoA ligase [Bradyrhizobium brasilense]
MNDMPWIRSYPDGVRWDVEIAPGPVQKILGDAVAKWPDRPAIDFMGKRITYAELGRLTDRVAKGLQLLGVKPGVHVGLYLPNTPHYIISFFGILKAGGTAVNYSPLDAAKVLEHKIEDSKTDILITLDMVSLYPQMAAMLGKTRLKKLVVGSLGEITADPDTVVNQMKAAKQLSDVAWDDHHISFGQLTHNDGVYQAYPIDNPRETIAVLQYTGGTTGLPKGAMLTHANLTSACQQYRATTAGSPPVLVDGQERFLAVLPPFHIYALSVNVLFGVLMGAEIIQHVRFDPKAALEEISTKSVSVFCGVPTMFTALINHPETPKHSLRALKYCGSGGAPLPLEVAQQFASITGCNLSEGWGMTETSPSGTYTPAQHGAMRKAGSCGMPMPGIVIKFLNVDDSSSYVPLGERGEICIKGPNVMKGYWNKPDATAEVTTADGYMRTGDVGYMDEDGFIFIVDRTKDMLLCSGYNVYPRVLEEAIYKYPAVEEVAVIGIRDEYRGQSPKAFIKLKADAKPFKLEELQAFLKDKLGKHEMVQALEIRAELPKTAVGKLSKKELYDEEERAARAQA